MPFFCDPDSYCVCPYDANHSNILLKHFQYHVIKCARNNPSIRRVRCMFNATHLCAPESLVKHMSNCPDNGCVHSALADGMADFDWNDERKSDTDLPSDRTTSVALPADNWDDESCRLNPLPKYGNLALQHKSEREVVHRHSAMPTSTISSATASAVMTTATNKSNYQPRTISSTAHQLEPRLPFNPFAEEYLMLAASDTESFEVRYEAIRKAMLSGGVGRGKPRQK